MRAGGFNATGRSTSPTPPPRAPRDTTTSQRPHAVGGIPPPARPRRILYIFSGPHRPTDGVAAFAAMRGWDTTEVDTLVGGDDHDVLLDGVRRRILDAVAAGEYDAVLIATPCTSFSVARGNHADGRVHYGLRTFEHRDGPPDAPEAVKAFVRKHNVFVRFTVAVARLALRLDLDLIIENPAPRHVPDFPSYWPARAHLPQLWDMQPVLDVYEEAAGGLSLLVIPQCAFGPGPHGLLFQKYTGLLCSRRAATRLADLTHLTCNHASHDKACGTNAAIAAAYPAPLNDALVAGLTGIRRTSAAPPRPSEALAADADAQAQADDRLPEGRGGPKPEPVPKPHAPPALAHDERGRRLEPPPPPNATAPTAPPPSAPVPPDRTLRTGLIADGPALSEPVRLAVEEARTKRKRWASHRNLEPASEAERRAAPMPNLLPHDVSTNYPGPPSQPGAAARLAELKASLGRDVHIEDLWVPDEWRRLQRWMRDARRGGHQPPARFPQTSLVPLARGYVWDTRDPRKCVPMEPSTERTVFPGRRQIDRAAFRRIARDVGSRDADIVGQARVHACTPMPAHSHACACIDTRACAGDHPPEGTRPRAQACTRARLHTLQVGGGGVESRSTCALTTELHTCTRRASPRGRRRPPRRSTTNSRRSGRSGPSPSRRRCPSARYPATSSSRSARACWTAARWRTT